MRFARTFVLFLSATLMALVSSCSTDPGFVTREGTQFIRNGKPYYYIGANYWVGPLLASPGESGDWDRLTHDLDALQAVGVDNLRVLVGGDEACPIYKNIKPFLQRLDGTYDEDLLVGLDRFMAELGRRGMTAVLYFNNSCDWSGGYVHYVKRVIGADSPSFWDWEDYHDYCAPMFTNTEVQEAYLGHIRNIVSRVNSETGVAYKDDPTIFSWQLANEPRAFFEELHPQFIALLHEAAKTIRGIDPNHLISTGMEGQQGTEGLPEEYETVHADPLIDYLTFHIWPDNFHFSDLYKVSDTQINNHLEVARKLGKPLVIEEFGLIRDEGSIDPAAPVVGRDEYYSWLFEKVANSALEGGILAGANFWAFAGSGRARSEDGVWELGDDFLGDPPFEPQGKFSVFDTDTSTLSIIKYYNDRISNDDVSASVVRHVSDSCFVCELPYINKEEKVSLRQIIVYTPGKVTGKIPLVFDAHYGLRFRDGYVQRCLSDGIAFACPYDLDGSSNACLTDDDLVFNNAALWYLRNLDFVDPTRIAIRGESAGGYMTLMLSSLNMGICAASAQYPLINSYFNFNVHFRNAHEFNMAEQQAGRPVQFSVIEMIYDSFMPSIDYYDGDDDIAKWEALSPLGLAQCVSTPTLIHQFTSDMLVPMDQLCRDYTREDVGESVPEGYMLRMPRTLPGILGQSYVERLQQGSYVTRYEVVEDNTGYHELFYDPDYLVNVDIFDDGPTEAYASHRVDYGTAYFDDYGFIKDMLDRSLSDTDILVPEKLALLLERYGGDSVQLPAHHGFDPDIYGSVGTYRRQVVDELSLWVSCNSLEELDSAMDGVTAGNSKLEASWKKIRKQL